MLVEARPRHGRHAEGFTDSRGSGHGPRCGRVFVVARRGAALFVSPITYPLKIVPHAVRAIYALNPVVGELETYRWMLFPHAVWPGAIIIVPIVASVLLLVSGAAYFQHAERTFADVI